MPYTPELNGIQYKEFIDYKSRKSSKGLPLPPEAYWKPLIDVLTQYVRHDDGKFDYVNGIVQRKHIIADKIRYIGKKTNNIDESNGIGIEEDEIVEYKRVCSKYNASLVKRIEVLMDTSFLDAWEEGSKTF